MTKKFPCSKFPHLIHGGDYNPEQWIDTKDIWDEDMRLMKLANCNEMSVGIFSWSILEPKEGEYDFSFLDEIIDKIHTNGGKVILATPSGARPRWMAEKYPEVLRVNSQGDREHFRARHNHCFTSPIYREKVRQMNRRLAERYGKHPAVIAWHISNEYGGECRCPLCVNAFQEFLRRKFQNDIHRLNHAYWSTFWSHTYDNFEQIDPPGPLTEEGIHGLNLDWKRFVTHQTRDFFLTEIEPIREVTPDLPVTINMMPGYYGLNYAEFIDVLDFISWDDYPAWHSQDEYLTAQDSGFWHDMFRSMKQKPYLLMESTPSNVNWQTNNKLKEPGMDVLASIHAIAHGSDSVQYFQWRKSRGSCEKFHGAVVSHDGTEHTRVFRSVQQTGAVLKAIDEVAGTVCDAEVAVIFDWENMWALDNCQGYAKHQKHYYQTCFAYHRVFWDRGINCDVVSPKADLSRYKLVIAPMQYLTDRQIIDNFTAYVSGGGTLYATYMLGTVDENDLCWLGGIPANGLKEVFGILNEEIDTLYPHMNRHAVYAGKTHELCTFCEVVHLRGAQVLATYTDGFYKDMPAVTSNRYGQGRAIYQACRDCGSLKEEVLSDLIRQLDIRSVVDANAPLPHGVTAQSRTDGAHTYVFVLNYSDTPAAPVKLRGKMTNILSGEETDTCTLDAYGFCVFRSISE